jgi:hypothetical protein
MEEEKFVSFKEWEKEKRRMGSIEMNFEMGEIGNGRRRNKLKYLNIF